MTPCYLLPLQKHYYQPMWTMVGGGMKTVEQSARPMKDVLPAKADWIQDQAVGDMLAGDAGA